MASELAEFLSRKDNENDLIVIAYEKCNERPIGSIVIDTAYRDAEGAHLRWFIVEQQNIGNGLGRNLIERALLHCDRKSYKQVYLTTFRGLDAARALYECSGFKLESENNVESSRFSDQG